MPPTCPRSARCGYVGIDNHGAGVTAAYLMDQWLGPAPSDVLITLSRDGVPRRGGARGRVPRRRCAVRAGRIVEVSDSDGIDATNERLVLEALERNPAVEAVYSVGGGNTATVAAFEKLGRPCRVFVAHDLDADNRRLLRDGRISVVLHNDLRADARLAMRLILQQRGALPAEPVRASADPGRHALQPARVTAESSIRERSPTTISPHGDDGPADVQPGDRSVRRDSSSTG